MMSFRRKSPTSNIPQRNGTKPFLHGQTLVTSGLNELDMTLGGGLLLRTLNLVETTTLISAQDASSLDLSSRASDALSIDLLRYFVAEGVVDREQRVALVAPDAAGFINLQLPLELSLAQSQVKQQLADKEDDVPLEIAWQYGNVEQNRANHSRRFCHSYDLSKSMHQEMVLANEPIAIDLTSVKTSTDVGAIAAYDHLYLAIENVVLKHEQNRVDQVLRIGILGLGSPEMGSTDAAHMRALFIFFKRFRTLLCQSTNAVSLILVASDTLGAFPATFINELRHVSDSVLTLNSFAGSRDLLTEELQAFQGSLMLRKLPRLHSLTCHAPSNARFGIKRDPRKLRIEKFHLPPEGSRTNDKSKGCNSITPGSSSGHDLLAF
ncbi:hypothetical protein CCR75_007655 [Bremia lactucae]|uniref:Elongator complex protein 4 n=1 Tax=Bremia lactucae TaxID=4779 RepID=A0A976IKJ8_BRELC|nr:hypothetical protein CCR75_007655 [Bremia lactucae]